MTTAQRRHITSLLNWQWNHRFSWDYPPGDQRSNRDSYSWDLSETQMESYILGGHRPQMDCSEFGSWMLKSVGAWPWHEPGYTGSHLATLPAYIDAKLADVGALVVFGGGTGHHEAVVYKPDHKRGNPVLQSHGRPGMDRPTLSQMTEEFRYSYPGVRFLSVAHL